MFTQAKQAYFIGNGNRKSKVEMNNGNGQIVNLT